jgi:hypothetical protein
MRSLSQKDHFASTIRGSSLLMEHRAALVSAVGTGKIHICGATSC